MPSNTLFCILKQLLTCTKLILPAPSDLLGFSTAQTWEDHPNHPPAAAHVRNTASHHCCNLLLRGEQEFYMVFSKDARLCIHQTQKLVFERGGVCVCVWGHNVHAKTGLPLQ